MIHQRLLMQAVQDSDPVLVGFVQALAPKILEHFAIIPALGGSGKPRPAPAFDIPEQLQSYTEEELQRFSRSNPDQSMATHILNGIFAGMRLAAKLPPNKEMTTEEKKLWILGYLIHDYTKVYGLKVPAGELPAIRLLVERLGEQMDFEKFLPNWKHWLDDVVWLGQNTQTKEGANLNLQDYPALRTPPRRLEVLRMLSSIADILVHIKSPALDAGTQANLRAKFAALFGADEAPRLAYHKLIEVRGLLSNIVNNVLMDEMVGKNQEPFLFFPDGVIYLSFGQQDIVISADDVAKKVWEQVVLLVGNSDFGIQRMGTGFIPSSALQELVGMEGTLRAGRAQAMKTFVSHAEARLYGFYTNQSNNDLEKEFGKDKKRIKSIQEDFVKGKGLLYDVRVDRLGEFLTFVYRTIKDNIKKAPDVTPVILQSLKLQSIVTAEEATRQKGGTYFGWFYIASNYIELNKTKDDSEIENAMFAVIDDVLNWITSNKLEARSGSAIGDRVKSFITDTIEIDRKRISLSEHNPFASELNRFMNNKENRKSICSLCSSPYDGVKQETAEVPFGNQQYSNKNPLSTGMIQRGICPVCRIEMILRRVQQPNLSEDDKPIQVFIYPTYFFTPETAFVVKRFRDRFENISENPTNLLEHLRKNGFTLSNFLQFEEFLIEDNEIVGQEQHPHYSHHDLASLFFLPLVPIKPKGRQLTDTDQWAMPVFYALAFPLLLNVKVVVTTSHIPVYRSGGEFLSTSILDGAHPFSRYILPDNEVRVDELEKNLFRLLAVYDLHNDVFSDKSDLHWPQLNMISKDIATDLYYVFSYFDKKKRKEKNKDDKGKSSFQQKSPTQDDLRNFTNRYQTLGGEKDMGIVGEIVNAYALFYRADWGKLSAAYAVLKPLSEAADVVVESDTKTEKDDLILLVAGAIGDLMERVRGNQADGFNPILVDTTISYPDRLALSREKQMAFATLFVEKVFYHYCNGDRALLRERINRLRSAARFYYLSNYSYNKKEMNND